MRAIAAAFTAAIATVALTCPPAGAAERPFAPVDRPGPPLSVPDDQLARNLVCTGNLASAQREPVLLVPGTTVTPAEFAWNYMRAFRALGIPYCSIELPEQADGDIQVAGEYVVYAIRRMHELTGRKIEVIGHSQGGMVPRWALRFWPDTRAMVDDQIGFAPSNHGTLDSEYCDITMTCPAAFWQQRASAAFVRALNSFQETFPGISYTEVYSHHDEVVFPNTDQNGSSSLHGGGGAITNVALQDICPLDPSEHLAIGTYDAVAYALALDAIEHPGPADPARIDRSVCTQPFQPGVDPKTFATDYGSTLASLANGAATATQLPAEPALRCYVFADCATAAAQAVKGARQAAPRRRSARHRRAHRSHRRAHRRHRATAHRRSASFTG
jgi:Lipase (class 2)